VPITVDFQIVGTVVVDGQGRLTINEHGNRRVTRLEKDGSLTVLADRYEASV
jgi:gluconolactonase